MAPTARLEALWKPLQVGNGSPGAAIRVSRSSELLEAFRMQPKRPHI
ncbi:MAG: hypothetical protein ACRD3D_12730 [Terriglobia bacterium]